MTYPSPAEFQHNEYEVFILEEASESDDVGVIQTLVNGDFRGHLLPLVWFHDHRLGDNFASKNFIRLHICDLVAFRKTSFSKKATTGIFFLRPRIYEDIGDFFQRRRYWIHMGRRLRSRCTHIE